MSREKKIVIVDYGLGNIHSISKAFANFGQKIIISNDSEVIENADGVVLPGVGAYGAAMKGLEKFDLVSTISKIADQNKPLLGICVGAQLFFSEGHEFGIHKGLGIVPGKVIKFDPKLCSEKIPHIGWNSIFPKEGKTWENTIFENVGPADQLYFVHSYYFKPDSEENILSMTTYGGYMFCSAVKKGNVYGCQFHPEKSGKIGLNIIHGFIKTVDSID